PFWLKLKPRSPRWLQLVRSREGWLRLRARAHGFFSLDLLGSTSERAVCRELAPMPATPPDERNVRAKSGEAADVSELVELRRHVDSTKAEVLQTIAGVQSSLSSLATQFAKGWTSVEAKLESKIDSLADTQAEQEARIDHLEQEIKNLHQLLGNIKREKPIPPVATSSSFDRDVDACILILRTKLSSTRAAIKSSISAWLQRAQLDEGDVEWEGDETSNRHVLRVKGARLYAARKVQQAIGALRLPNNSWERFKVAAVSCEDQELFISPDKNQAQVKRELGIKHVRRELELHYPSLKFFSDKTKGEVSTQWKPLVRVEPLPGDALPRFEFAMENLRAFSIDKDTILSGVKANYRQQSDTQWSI
ncbi:unnamed protein product, partial [Prorocentrum cordatum]